MQANSKAALSAVAGDPCAARPFEGGFELDYSLRLAAPRERVFAAMTDEVHHWWPHTVREQPHRIVLESQIGGRFMELFDEQGRGVLYGLVEIFDPPAMLRIRGSVGMGRAVNLQWTVTLSDEGGSTLLREQCRVSGDISDTLREGMRKGTETEYEALRQWIEAGTAIR
ncbi:SRPBCC domain-containing protein [bacterium]|nr:SRPBCC domain-containing protein [bacterium]